MTEIARLGMRTSREYFRSHCTINLDIEVTENEELGFIATFTNNGPKSIIIPEVISICLDCLIVESNNGARVFPSYFPSPPSNSFIVKMEPGASQSIVFTGLIEKHWLMFSNRCGYEIQGGKATVRFTLHRIESNSRIVNLTSPPSIA